MHHSTHRSTSNAWFSPLGSPVGKGLLVRSELLFNKKTFQSTSASTLERQEDVDKIPNCDPGATTMVDKMSEDQKAAMLKALLKEKPRLTKNQTRKLFQEADLDGDENLTREEFDRVLIRFGERGYKADALDLNSLGIASDDDEMTSLQKKALFLSQAIPFVGFGFMDNAIMIIAGEYIEMYIGTALALSTMAAAGLGNLLSDIAGIGFSKKIETLTESWLNIRPPELSRRQASHFNAKFIKIAGAVIGISVGCILGMFPLLFFDADHDHNLRPEDMDEKDVKLLEKKGFVKVAK